MASASNSTSEEAQSTSASRTRSSERTCSGASENCRSGPSEFSSAFGSFLNRSVQSDEQPGSSRFSAMLRDLKSDDSTRQMMALTELSEYLSFSSEEALISFPMETFIPILIGLLEDPGPGDETAGQAMLLCCRCLFNVVDVLPPTTRIITAAGGLPALCQNLLNVAYIDVAELAVAIIERIAEDQPLQVLKAGGLQAILTFLDFFQIAVQRQAAHAAALMLFPIPPMDIFDTHVRSVLPTLATLLQHNDPQVLQSVCECWRRVLDNTITIHGRPRPGSGSIGSSSSLGRMAAKGKWRGSPAADKGKKEKPPQAEEPAESPTSGGSAQAAPAAAAAAARPLAAVLEEMCPGGLLSNLLVLLSNGISSPSPHSSTVMAEVLYILSVLTNYSDALANEVLQQDMAALLRQMMLAMDLSPGGGGPSSQTSSLALLRLLGIAASILPAAHLSGLACSCEEKRLALFTASPEHLDQLGDTFLPILVDVYEASMDPCVQALCLTLLVTFLLACREQPETIQRSLDPTRLACFLANLLLAGASASKSVSLACLLIANELLERQPTPYALLFVRHGVVCAVERLATRGGGFGSQRRRGAGGRNGGSSPGGTPQEAAQRVLAAHAAASAAATGCESTVLRELGQLAAQLRDLLGEVVPAHKEVLGKLRDLIMAPDGITAFEFLGSGMASALHAFLYPASDTAADRLYGERLRLVLESFGSPGSGSGAFVKLVHLCVAAVQRNEQEPLHLFPTHASLATALPPHLRLQPPLPAGIKGGAFLSRSSSSGLGLELLPGSPVARGARGGEGAGPGAASSLSVLRLLAKPVRVRVTPHGAAPAASGSSLADFRALLKSGHSGKASGSPSPASTAAAAAAEPKAADSGPAPAPTVATSLLKAGADPLPAAAPPAASPAARLRNYLASKVGRKRSTSSTGSAVAAAASAAASAMPAAPMPTPAGDKEKRGGVSSLGLLAKNRLGQASAAVGGPSRIAPAAAEAAPESKHAAARHGEALEGSRGSPAGGGLPLQSAASSRGSQPGSEAEPPEGSRSQRARALAEAVEAVLLVDPLASVAALEDYIWERHGPRSRTPDSRTGRASSPTKHEEAKKQPPQPSTPSSGAAAAAGEAEDAPSPGTPVAVFEPDGAAEEGSPASRGSDAAPSASLVGRGARAAQKGGGAGAPVQPPRQRVQVYLNGHALASKASVVQALVAHATAWGPPPLRSGGGGQSGPSGGRRHPSAEASERGGWGRDQRYLVCADEDDSSSEADGGGEDDDDAGSPTSGRSGGGRVRSSSSRHFCATVWGRVHAMTFELLEEGRSPVRGEKVRSPSPGAAASSADAAAEALARDGQQAMMVVATDFDCLVQRHRRILALGAARDHDEAEEASPGAGSTASAAAAPAASAAIGAGGALTVMLQLVSALHNLREHLRLSGQDGSGAATEAVGLRAADDEDFQCNSLTSKLLRQLSDPLAICTGSIPTWCMELSGTCRFLFPQSARRLLHHRCSLGLGRALHHVQQQRPAAAGGGAAGQEAQRRLEGEVAVASIPRQKVRISRQRILESAIKVMDLYGNSSTILEVEFVGEVGTGSGPTLEFYAQVAELLRTSEPRLFRERVPGGMLFPEPRDPEWLRKGEGQAAQILERFRLLGQVVAKCVLDNRLVDLQLHPFFWRSVLCKGPFSRRSLREVDPTLYTSLQELQGMEAEALSALCVDFTLPGQPTVQLQPAGAEVSLSHANVDAYIARVTEVTLVEAIAPQVEAFREAFAELLSLETCRIWSEVELTSLIMGSSVQEDGFWTTEHLAAHIKAQHGYSSESRCFRDLLAAMSGFSPESRRKFLTFTTGAPSLPVGGFSGLKPPLTVVKKEAPPAPLSPDHFMPSVMTCANYFKLPEYSSAAILSQKLELAMNEGQSAFLLS